MKWSESRKTNKRRRRKDGWRKEGMEGEMEGGEEAVTRQLKRAWKKGREG